MKDIKLSDQLTVKLKASEWFYLLGLLGAVCQDSDDAYDLIYKQIMDQTE